MDPGVSSLLFLGFIIAIAATAFELRASLGPPVCAECQHCRDRLAEERRREEELRDWYARRWGVGDRDEDDTGHR